MFFSTDRGSFTQFSAQSLRETLCVFLQGFHPVKQLLCGLHSLLAAEDHPHALLHPGRQVRRLGFLLAIYLFSTVRERLEFADYPKAFEGFPIALITAGLIALAFMGFSGLQVWPM